MTVSISDSYRGAAVLKVICYVSDRFTRRSDCQCEHLNGMFFMFTNIVISLLFSNMASHWLSDRELICLISSLQNLWSPALIIQHGLLSNILKRRTDRHRVLKLMLCDKVISKEKKKFERKKREYWIRPGRTKKWQFQFLNDEVIADEQREIFRMSKQSFLVFCEELRQ